jgi:hypothetical protein
MKCPSFFIARKETQYRRLGGSQVRSGQVQKKSPPQRFHPQTVQPIGELLYQLCYLCYLVHSTNFEALQSAPFTSVLLFLHVYCEIRQNIITYINGQLLLSSHMNTCMHTKTHNHQYFLRSKIFGVTAIKT